MTIQDFTQTARLLKNGVVVASGRVSLAKDARSGVIGWNGDMTVPGVLTFPPGDGFVLQVDGGPSAAVLVRNVYVESATGGWRVSRVFFLGSSSEPPF